MEETIGWACDKCHRPIESVKEGWVEWLSIGASPNYRSENLRLVHHTAVIKTVEPLYGSRSARRT